MLNRVRDVPMLDLVLALAMLPVQLVGVLFVSMPVYALDTGGAPPVRLEHTPADGFAVGLLCLSALALVTRTLWPRFALAATAGLFAAYMVGGYPVGPVMLPVMACLFTVALAGSRRWAMAALAVVVAAASAWVPRMAEIYHGDPALLGTVITFYGVLIAMFGGSVLAGEVFRARREAAEAGISEAVTEERLRIARELHDVVAHSMAGIAVQSAAALRMLGDPPPEVRASLTAIRTTSKEALQEIQATVGTLRGSGGHTADLGRLDALVTAVRNAGVPVELQRSGKETPLPPEVGHSAYRIVQESLTNVLRHAGHGATARVRVTYDTADLLLDVADDGGGSTAAPGNGLSGMRERAEAVGGSLRTGNGPDGGFQVSARLPLGRRA